MAGWILHEHELRWPAVMHEALLVKDARIQIAWPHNQIQVCCTMSASLLNIDNQLCQKLLNVTIKKIKQDIPYRNDEHIMIIRFRT